MKHHVSTLSCLLKEAKKACRRKGHDIQEFHLWPNKDVALASCARCEKTVGVLLRPYPSEKQISGDALTSDCKKKRRKIKWL